MVKKVALEGLGDPINSIERDRYWEKVYKEESTIGVRGRVRQVDVSGRI
jgi:serine protease AprX